MSEAPRHNFAPEDSGSSGLSRRQIVKAGVWAAPVVAVAVAAPAATASVTGATVTAAAVGKSGKFRLSISVAATVYPSTVTIVQNTASAGVTWNSGPSDVSATSSAPVQFGEVQVSNAGTYTVTVLVTPSDRPGFVSSVTFTFA